MKRLGLTLLVVAMISGVAYYVFTHPNLERVERLHEEVEKLKEQNEELQAENERLQKRVVALRDDPRLAERKAREWAGLARPGEVVFQFERPDEEVEVAVRLEVEPDSIELAGRAIQIDELDRALKALERDVPTSQLTVSFDEKVDELRRQKVIDAVKASPLSPATYE